MKECVICTNDREYIEFECKHTVCIHCYQELLNRNHSCPFCRNEIEPIEIEIEQPIVIEQPHTPNQLLQLTLIHIYVFLLIILIYFLYKNEK